MLCLPTELIARPYLRNSILIPDFPCLMQASFYSQRRWNCFALCLASPAPIQHKAEPSAGPTPAAIPADGCAHISTLRQPLRTLDPTDPHSELQETMGHGNKAAPAPLQVLLTLFIIAEQRAFLLLTASGIFPTLAKILKGNPRCAVKAAHVLSEIAKNGESCPKITTRHFTAP